MLIVQSVVLFGGLMLAAWWLAHGRYGAAFLAIIAVLILSHVLPPVLGWLAR